MVGSEGIHLGRRIAEILADRNISPNDFSKRITFCKKDTFYDCLEGRRYIKPSELQEIAEKLHLSIERIKQEDMEKDVRELKDLISRKIPSLRAVELGKTLQESAIGWTEQFDALNFLGAAYFYLRKINDAHSCWLQALAFAQKIQKRFGEIERLHTIVSHLLSTYGQKKDYSSLAKLLEQVEPEFAKSHPRRAGIVALYYAITASNMEDNDMACIKLEESLAFWRLTNDQNLIGKGYHNLAYHYFRVNELAKSKEMFETAIDLLGTNNIDCLIAKKDYIKTLVKMKNISEARKVITVALEQSHFVNDPELVAKLNILYSLAFNESGRAEKALYDETVSDITRMAACKILMQRCMQAGDSDGLMKYYKEADRINKSESSTWEVI